MVIENNRSSLPKLSTKASRSKVKMFVPPKGTATGTLNVPVTGVSPDGQPSKPIDAEQPLHEEVLILPNAEVKIDSEGKH